MQNVRVVLPLPLAALCTFISGGTMHRSGRRLLAVASLLAGSLVLIGSPTATAEKDPAAGPAKAKKLCSAPTVDLPSCDVQVMARPNGTPVTHNDTPVGYGPAAIHGAYDVPTEAPGDVTIALIVGFDNPNVKADLDVYNQRFGLPFFPSCSSTVTTSCFQKVKQKNSISTNEAWIMESSLDVQMAHQMCRNCKILLVEGTTNSWTNLMWAVDKAVSLGADVVNASFAGVEAASLYGYDKHFDRPGVAFVAASGDWGYDVRYPASSRFVTAVGGTTLTVDEQFNSWVSETVWNRAGSGCSLHSPKPDFQPATPQCSKRAVADVSAAADPASGAAIYNSFGISGQTGWFEVGGTSLAAPIISGIYALGGMTSTGQQNALPYLKGNASNLRDITSGSTSTCGSYLCEGSPGYDGPSGLGSPRGLGAFQEDRSAAG